MPLFQVLENENAAQGVSGGTFKAGRSDVDPGAVLEKGLKIPWCSDPDASWFDYRCWKEVYLDPGIVVHKALPQAQYPFDTLSAVDVDRPDLQSSLKTGLVSRSQNKFADTVQRMATSTYYFRLRGYAIRLGYQVPIPKLVEVWGVTAVPLRQWAAPKLVGNFSGVPLWRADWDLWYTVAMPPTASEDVPPANVAARIRGDQQLPTGMQVPFSSVDYNAVPAAPVFSKVKVT